MTVAEAPAVVTLFDAVTPAHIPANPPAVAGYDDGDESEWPAEAWGQFPGALKIHITVKGLLTSDVADVETGDLTPQSGALWAKARVELGKRPCIYTNFDNWPACQAACAAVGLTAQEVDWWIAQWGPQPGQGNPHLLPGSVATQWDHDLAPGYDISERVASWRPSAPISQPEPGPIPVPTPPQPGPVPAPAPEADVQPPAPVLSEGANNPAVGALQELICLRGWTIKVDDDFGPITAGAVRAVEAHYGLTRDAGVAGPQVWGALVNGHG